MLDKTDGGGGAVKAACHVKRRIGFELGLIAILAATAAALWFGRGTAGPPTARNAVEDAAQNAAQDAVEGEMFQWKPGQYVLVQRGEGVSNEIDESRFADLATKNAADLAAWANMAWENQWGYLWGTFGDVLDEGLLDYKIDQYGDDVLEYEDVVRAKWMGRRVADCAGLIKGYGWYDPVRHDIEYDSSDMPDVGADGLYERASDKGPIDTMPDTPGVLVYAQGHIGVYVGGGWVVEAISHAGGVVRTRLEDRTWTHWLRCPFIQY